MLTVTETVGVGKSLINVGCCDFLREVLRWARVIVVIYLQVVIFVFCVDGEKDAGASFVFDENVGSQACVGGVCLSVPDDVRVFFLEVDFVIYSGKLEGEQFGDELFKDFGHFEEERERLRSANGKNVFVT